MDASEATNVPPGVRVACRVLDIVPPAPVRIGVPTASRRNALRPANLPRTTVPWNTLG